MIEYRYDSLDELAEQMEGYNGHARLLTTTPDGVTYEAQPRFQWREQVDGSTWSVTTAPAVLAYQGVRSYGIRNYSPTDPDDIRAMIAELQAAAEIGSPHLTQVREASDRLATIEATAQEVRAERDAAMRTARDHGEKPADIANAASVGMAYYYRVVGKK